ncbi:MAG TPA: cupin domain-containing protein [Terriglobales bacterium]|nr:cupin domain-containing protein [Terriglobales bacterium]
MGKVFKHALTSSEIAEQAALYLLGTLPEADHAAFELHLEEGCQLCEAEVIRASAEISALARSGSSTAPADLRDRFLAKLKIPRRLQPDSAGILLNHSGLLIARTDAIDWRATDFPGVWSKPLFIDELRHRATSLIKMDPGATYPPHRHYGSEELYFLSGDLAVGGVLLKAGDYSRAAADSIHGGSRTEFGCLFVLVASQLDEILR